VHSQVRSLLFGAQYQPQFTGQGTWRYNVARPSHIIASFFRMGDGLPFGKCGFIPLSQESGYVWLVQSEPGNPRHPSAQLADIFRERLSACTGVESSLQPGAWELQPVPTADPVGLTARMLETVAAPI